jgi:hypothetical protein
MCVIRRSTLRRRLAWVALVVLLCSIVASLRMRFHHASSVVPVVGCTDVDRDSVRLVRLATDTIATLRGRTQRVKRVTWTPDGLEIRTEDSDRLAAHDGGLAAFDCAGRLTFLWLDGG